MKGNNRNLAVHTWSHFCVDFACFCILYGAFWPGVGELGKISAGFLLYNVLAFGLQPLLGAACDRGKRLPLEALGCGMVLAALLFAGSPWTALTICALGNACFHVGGGRSVLLHSEVKLAPGGVFVSSGALGVGLGTLAGKAGASFLLPGCLLAAALLLQLLAAGKCAVPEPPECAVRIAAARPFWIVLGLAFTSVVIRAWAGGEIPMDWRTDALALAPAAASCAGKALGGFAADRFGAGKVGVAALLCAAPLLCFGGDSAALSLLGIVLFNFTMPISLGTVVSLLPATPGFAFGLTTLALLLGSMPQLYWKPSGMTAAAAVAGLTLLSAGCLAVSVRRRERRNAS